MADARQKTYAKTMIEFGPLVLPVELVPGRAVSKEHDFVSVCPNDGAGVKQLYECCADPSHRWTMKDLKKGAKTQGGAFVTLTDAEVADVFDPPLAKGTLRLQVAAAADVEGRVWPDEGMYRVRLPRGVSSRPYALLRDIVAKGNDVLYGETVIGGRQRLVMLAILNGQLVVQTLIRPDDLAPADEFELDPYDGRELAGIEGLVETMREPFDPQLHRNVVREKAAQLAASKAGVVAAAVTDESLADLLARSIEQLGGTPPGAKKSAPRKRAAAKKAASPATPARRRRATT